MELSEVPDHVGAHLPEEKENHGLTRIIYIRRWRYGFHTVLASLVGYGFEELSWSLAFQRSSGIEPRISGCIGRRRGGNRVLPSRCLFFLQRPDTVGVALRAVALYWNV